MTIYNLKFYRHIGDDHLGNVFCYTVIAASEEEAISKFLKVDKSASPLSTDFGLPDFNEKYPEIANNLKCKSLIHKMEEAGTDDLDPQSSEEEYEAYHEFIINNLDLITEVLLIINNKCDCFTIEEGVIISY